MQITWNGTPYPHGWQFGLAGSDAVLLVAGGGVIDIVVLDLCDTSVLSLMPLRSVVSLMPMRTTARHCEES